MAKYCRQEDILTPITRYSLAFDDDRYTHQSQNDDGFYNHISPAEIKNKIDLEVWNSYFKFTVVRNPWDQVVSRFCWEKSFVKFKVKRSLRKIKSSPFNLRLYKRLINFMVQLARLKSFKNFLNKFEPEWTNTRFYFDAEGRTICDYYIKYENLQAGFNYVCGKLEIKPEQLPRLKSKTRNHELHYSDYYNDKTQALVANLFKREIEYFGYSF